MLDRKAVELMAKVVSIFGNTSITAENVTKFFNILEFGSMSKEEDSFMETFLPKFRNHMDRELSSPAGIAGQSDQ